MQLIAGGHKEEITIKSCEQCGARLHDSYPKTLCPSCIERNLFSDVKEFIRSRNDVREQDVAQEFNIPIRKVRDWIKEGRIQYKDDKGNTISSVSCRVCGKPISFGVTCPKCHSMQNLQVFVAQKKEEDAEMRFLGN